MECIARHADPAFDERLQNTFGIDLKRSIGGSQITRHEILLINVLIPALPFNMIGVQDRI